MKTVPQEGTHNLPDHISFILIVFFFGGGHHQTCWVGILKNHSHYYWLETRRSNVQAWHMFSTLILWGDPAGSSASHQHLTFPKFFIEHIMVVWVRTVVHWLRCENTWSPVSGVIVGYGGDLEEACPWGWPQVAFDYVSLSQHLRSS